MDVPAATRLLDQLYVAAEGAGLRQEDRKKAVEVAALIEEIRRVVLRSAKREAFILVDAAAGKAYVGLIAAKLVFEQSGIEARVVTIERDPDRVTRSREAALRLGSTVPIECRTGDVGDATLWPDRPSLVVALHACGSASDRVIERCISSQARHLLLVPCCTERSDWADSVADRHAIPRHAPVRRRYVQALVDSIRTWQLEAAGYQTEVVELVGATTTPHNLLWRSVRVGEPGRMARAAIEIDRLRSG